MTKLMTSFLIVMGILASSIGYAKQIPLVTTWEKRCAIIPHYKEMVTKNPGIEHDYSVAAIGYKEFMSALEQVTDLYKKSDLTNSAHWVDGAALSPSFFNAKAKDFDPYIQAMRVAPGTEIIMFGDRHGDVRSTVSMIQELRQKGYFAADDSFTLKPGVLLVGLGDYVDRGNAGVETFATMLWLKLQNPDQVILVRGNHEDCDMSTNQSQFQVELQQKLGAAFSKEDMKKVNRIYDFMPVAVFIGSGTKIVNFLVGCHGFIEMGYEPSNLLELVLAQPLNTHLFEKVGKLMRAKQIEKLPSKLKKVFKEVLSSWTFKDEIGASDGIAITGPRSPIHLGWMWSYAIVDDGTKLFDYNSGNRTWQWGKDLTRGVLQQWSKPAYTVSWIFRGHQHAHNYEYASYGTIMHRLWEHDGVYRLWADDKHAHSLAPFGAFTLNVAPDNIYAGNTSQSTYPGFNYDTWIVVKTGADSTAWSMKIFNKVMFDLPEYPIYVDGKKIVPQKHSCCS